jgi:pyruvate,water dikinase
MRDRLLRGGLQRELAQVPSRTNLDVVWFENIGRADVALVGGKTASLGEMIRALRSRGVRVPEGFATTSDAYWRFIDENELRLPIEAYLSELQTGKLSLSEAGRSIRAAILRGTWPRPMADAIVDAYHELGRRAGTDDADVAVRSSATAEDLPQASFAGQQESYLNIRGDTGLLDACRQCLASLFTDRAISYRQVHGFDHMHVALTVAVQRMVRSDLGGAGVMFSIDTETGFDKVVLINAAWGLGENVVKGTIDPDEYQVFKPNLEDLGLTPVIERRLGGKAQKLIYSTRGDGPTQNVPTSKAERAAFVLENKEILALARWAKTIEEHFGVPMDMEWAKDGKTGELFMLQARPETVQSRRDVGQLNSYTLTKKGEKILSGLGIGDAAVSGRVCLIENARDIDRFIDGAILVASTTDPDWVPIMKRAAAVVTDHGGRTSHAAIVSRELGLPAIVGSGKATEILHDSQEITVSCAEGDEGIIYQGAAEIEVERLDLAGLPKTRTQVMLNMANPAAAYRWWKIPADGIGLARMEFVISNQVRIHPMALVHFETLKDEAARKQIEELTKTYSDKTDYFVDQLALGLARIAAVCHPRPVIIRMSDFKTNEYANLIGGSAFEPTEENPMIGFRGASRYYSPLYREGFELECRAIRRLREEMGFKNVVVMIPFCRSVDEADKVLTVMSENGLKRGSDELEIYVMCEIPANVIRAKEFAQRFDGFSIGSNDLTQLALGVDRDSAQLADLFDEQDPTVKWLIESVITSAHEAGRKVGICGQAPSDHPEFAEFLVRCEIDSISVSPDSFIAVKRRIAEAEREKS